MRGLIIMSCAFISIALSVEAKVATSAVQYKKYTPNDVTIIHVLTIDPQKTQIILARSQDIGKSIATVGAIAQHFKAIAAINGGFFRFNEQSVSSWVPAGAMKVNNQWHGIAYKPRGSIGWDANSGKVLFDIIQTKSNVLINNHNIPIKSMNKLGSINNVSLLSDNYIDSVNVINRSAIIISNNRVSEIYTSGTINIRDGAYMLLGEFDSTVIGDPAFINIKLEPQLDIASNKQWEQMPFILAGGPLLIHKKNKITDFKTEHLFTDFIESRHARTAVGVLADGRWVFVVVEGGFFQATQGMSIPELRDFMFSLGCISALNLDGGSSSAMYLQGDQDLVANERPIVNALLVLER